MQFWHWISSGIELGFWALIFLVGLYAWARQKSYLSLFLISVGAALIQAGLLFRQFGPGYAVTYSAGAPVLADENSRTIYLLTAVLYPVGKLIVIVGVFGLLRKTLKTKVS